ncbi:MAG: hypothetical protein HYV96_12535 [Opitutae bacterium]|nr:hypothetical protein [Opitutae bacterium]
MKTHRLPFTLLLLLGLLFASALSAHAAERVQLHAFLITASNERTGKSDPRLAPYEQTLRRIMRFESFEYQGSDRGELGAGESTTLMVGQGHELVIEAGKNPYQLRVRWSANVGERTLMNTGVTLRPGVPAVLGGPPTGRAPGEVYAVFIVAK